jgi:hypothetical protein
VAVASLVSGKYMADELSLPIAQVQRLACSASYRIFGDYPKRLGKVNYDLTLSLLN